MIIHLRTKDPFIVGLKVQGTLSLEGAPQSEYFASSPVPTNEGESHRLSLTIVGQPEEVELSLIGATSHPSFPNISIFSLESEDAANMDCTQMSTPAEISTKKSLIIQLLKFIGRMVA